MNSRRRRGRPLTGSEPLDKRFTLLVSDTTKKQLDQMEGAASDFVRSAIEAAMRRRGPARAKAKARRAKSARKGRPSRAGRPSSARRGRPSRGSNRTSRRSR